MIRAEKIHDLTVASSPNGDHPPHISAASGLVRHAGHIFIVADDELSLLVVNADDLGPGHFMPILEGSLPKDHEARQKAKADLESIAWLPPSGRLEHGSLLAMGSGSSDERNRGALIPLDRDAKPTEEHDPIDLQPLFDKLGSEVQGLNVEGAEVVGETLWLMQRGNEGGDNALINLSLEVVMRGLGRGIIPADALRSVDHVDLGELEGVKLCFSDASALADGRIVFAASAEDTDAATSDGANAGSALGIIEQDGSIGPIDRLDQTVKVEGIDARVVGAEIEVLMVTDADDPDTPSPLLLAKLSDPA